MYSRGVGLGLGLMGMTAAAAMGAAGGPALDWASQLWFAFLDRVPLSERVLFVVRTEYEGGVGWGGVVAPPTGRFG